MSGPGRRRSIEKKLTGVILIAALLPLALVGLVTYNQEQRALRESAREQLDAIATVQAARVESYLFFSEINLELVASRTRLGQLLGSFIAESIPTDQALMNQILSDARDSAKGAILEVHVADLDGIVRASTDPSRLDDDLSGPSYFADAQISPTLGSIATNAAGLDVGVHAGPIASSGLTLGVVVIEADLDPLLTSLDDPIGLGDSEESYLVRRDRNRPQLVTPLAEPDRFNNAAPENSPMELAMGEASGEVIEAVDYRGEDVFAAIRTIDSTGWGLVVKVDKAEALAPIANFRNLLVFGLVMAGLASVALAHVLSVRLTDPIRRLIAVAGQMSTGGSQRARLDTGDEIGELAIALNRMADQHDAALQELEGKNDQLQQFLYVSSHDLKTPLRAISSYGQLLAADQRHALSESGREYLDRINENSKRMYGLIDDLLAYVKAGQIEETFGPVNLDAVLERVRGSQELDLRTVAASLSISHLGTAHGSAVLLEEVFANLVSNSIKYRRPDAPTRIGITVAETNGDHVTIRVEDNGIGIPPEHRERVFQPFHRLHRNDDIAGTGVGLAICERVVSGHGGTIRATASNLGGTTILVTLPRFPPP